MKKILIVLIIALCIFSPRIYWQLKEETQLDVLIIDKTVPNTDYREHKGLLWFLTNEKIVKENGKLYDRGVDYFGYDPYEGQPMEPYKYAEKKDLIYVSDTYGVYSDDLKIVSEGERSELIYGGMDLAEWNEIMKTKSDSNVLIAEYNSFATPTNEAVRKVMEKDLNVQWSEWIGRFFPDLNSEEVPPWLKTNYESQYNKEWTFKQGGLALVHNSDRVVIIDEKQMNSLVQFQPTNLGKEKFEGISNSTYPYWFDIVEPVNDAVVLAEYKINVNEEAEKELVEQGIPTIFPAITFHEDNQIYYFSGDFADYTKDNLMKWQGSEKIMRIFSNEDSDFIWAAYIPVMRQIVNELK